MARNLEVVIFMVQEAFLPQEVLELRLDHFLELHLLEEPQEHYWGPA